MRFSCLDYPLEVSISWICLLSPYNWFCHISYLDASFMFMFMCACAHDTVFNTCSLIRIYRYTCAYPCTPLGIHHTTCWGVFDSPVSSCPDPGAWSLWILPVADQRCTAVAWIIDRLSDDNFVTRERLCTIHTCVSLRILTIARISGVIFF